MALSSVLRERKDSPYFKPPNLHINVLKIKEEEKVTAWSFTEATAVAATTKKNRVAAITDGQTITKITLFEEFGGKINEGSSYILRGYGLFGQNPPFNISISRQTQFFRASDMSISPEMISEGEKILNPPSKQVDLRSCGTETGLLTIHGESGFQMNICLWREASTFNLSVGDMVTLTHMKVESSAYGQQLKSTKFSKLEKTEITERKVCIIGVIDSLSSPNTLEVLTEEGATLEISKEKWAPLENQFKKGRVTVDLTVEGREIKDLKCISPS
ncbi:hypothetical protein FQA47_001764 [Oryzias melastigma]|uniref:Uncharacterized protein n=1 Tax=Oryzias melastigma TaxID=30732 RepID=A0A834CQT5_ORYME|nr:hypothetical protein FQA47_010573 [Oryzias melastigma]KAF6731010.1 hypothetical protein FQA47_001764 [Oryzias melastigma]